MIRVAIYDDNKHRRESLKVLIDLSEDVEFVDSYESCLHILENTELNPPDIILMDIEMPDADGIYGVKQMYTHYPSIKIIMQTVYEDADKIFQCLRYGAKGYILKNAPISEIIQSIKTVYEGGAFMTASVALKVMNYFQKKSEENTLLEKLTLKEKEVLEHLAEGLSYKLIADKMNIASGTVNNHLKKVYEKLHVNSAGEAISFFHKIKQ